jgi:beta-glucosidase-like glycosyl hydrolase
VNGKPACASGEFINQVLREEWGWDGMIVSDYTAVELMNECVGLLLLSFLDEKPRNYAVVVGGL